MSSLLDSTSHGFISFPLVTTNYAFLLPPPLCLRSLANISFAVAVRCLLMGVL
jgi:hypothetical protein